MSKRNLKLIMELIFIFILPLLFICFTSEIQVERNFEYDNNGNYETSIENKNLSFDNSIIKYTKTPMYTNYLDFNQLLYKINDENSYYQDLDSNYNQFYTFTNSYQLIENHYYYYNIQYLTESDNHGAVYFYPYNNSNIKLTLSNSSNIYQNIISSSNINTIYNIKIYADNTNYYHGKLIYQLIDLTQMFGYGYEPTTIQELSNYIDLTTYKEYTESEIIAYESNTQIAENYRINNTIWGNIKELLVTNLELNDNVLIDIVLCYMILWIINWIIWHIFYGFLELLIHIIPRKWERD